MNHLLWLWRYFWERLDAPPEPIEVFTETATITRRNYGIGSLNRGFALLTVGGANRLETLSRGEMVETIARTNAGTATISSTNARTFEVSQ